MSEEHLESQQSAEQSAPQESQQSVEQTAPQQSGGFRDLLPMELRDDPSLASINDVGALAKSFVNAQQMLGNSIRIPSQEADSEAWNKFYEKLETVPGIGKVPTPDDKEGFAEMMKNFGKPEDVSGYNFELADDFQARVDNGLMDSYKHLAHDLNLTNSQAQALVEFQMNAIAEQERQFIESGKQTEDLLKQMWGSAHDTNVALAQSTLRNYADKFPDAAQQIDQLAYYNPIIMDLLAQAGTGSLEGNHAPSEGTSGFGNISPEEAHERILELRKSEQYRNYRENPNDPRYRDIGDKLEMYYRIKEQGRRQ